MFQPISASGRPWRRRIIKLALAGAVGWSHSHNWLPSLRLTRNENGDYEDILYRGKMIAQLQKPDLLRGMFAGGELYIIGSGPSVATAKLDTVRPHSSILLNGACSLIGESIKQPLAIAIEDERFVWRHFDLLERKVAPGTIVLLSPGVIRALCEIRPGWITKMQIILVDDVRKPYGRRRRSAAELRVMPNVILNKSAGAGFSQDPAIGVFQGGSVVVSALQFGSYCQPSMIGLIGIDISNASQPRFYEEQGQVAFSGIQRSQARIIQHVEVAKQACLKQGTGLRSYSPTSPLNEIL
ncbi:glycosyl transferase [Terrihabitans rhizophilus]|uniref:Glycosyl transferase n=1 Tax=Terrihabitans rhizophilus TaxID=3092662 RepID=A0ABU4RS89_9HYPH|nr:glycosyl transferase [Terrihabitans sp. PJ23]MDX6805621.1 glycosyl transferase [Terrihabitans sp. PJ23]